MAGRMSMSQRRQLLIEATREVCRRDGVNAATTRAIAAEANMPLASVHYAFASRDELVEAVITGWIDSLSIDQFDDISAADGPYEFIDAVLTQLVDDIVADPDYQLSSLEMVNYTLRLGDDSELGGKQHRAMLRILSQLLQRIDQHGYEWSVPVEQVAWQILMLQNAVAQSYIITRDAPAAYQLVRITAPSIAAQARPRESGTS